MIEPTDLSVTNAAQVLGVTRSALSALERPRALFSRYGVADREGVRLRWTLCFDADCQKLPPRAREATPGSDTACGKPRLLPDPLPPILNSSIPFLLLPADTATKKVSPMSVRVCILGSGSGGNCALVATERTRLLIDAGFSFREIKTRLQKIGEDPKRLDAILITHEHSDHVSGLPVLARKLKRPVFITPLTESCLTGANLSRFWRASRAGQRLTIGDIEVDSFTIPTTPSIRWPSAFTPRASRSLVTDLGYLPDSVKHHARGCQLLALESNHDLTCSRWDPIPGSSSSA